MSSHSSEIASGTVALELPPVEKPDQKHSYGQILKSSALVGGAQILNIGIGIGRTKALALLLGPAGFGLAGVFNSIVDLTQSIAGLGVNGSGVRQIAEASGSGDSSRIALTISVLRRTSWVLGAIGALGLLLFCKQVSRLTFGTEDYAAGVAAMSLAAFCKLVAGGQAALIQGMRRISDLAHMNVWSTLAGAVMTVVLVYLFRQNGIVPSIVTGGAITTIVCWLYSRKVKIQPAQVETKVVGKEVGALLKLGLAFMVSSLATLGVAYANRVMVLHKVGIEGAGLYQSAWTVGGMYVGFILQAMAADFYPRLTASIHDHFTSNRLVNEQARVGLLLAGPGVLATLTFAPPMIIALYSAKFAGSVLILRWFCVGAILQVISWPMGFIIVAKGRQSLFILAEVVWAAVSLLLSWLCISRFGLAGAGLAFALSYLFHGLLVYPIARQLSGFRWSRENLETGGMFLSIIALVFLGFYFLPAPVAFSAGTLATILASTISFRVLAKIVSVEQLPSPFRRLLKIFDAERLFAPAHE